MTRKIASASAVLALVILACSSCSSGSSNGGGGGGGGGDGGNPLDGGGTDVTEGGTVDGTDGGGPTDSGSKPPSLWNVTYEKISINGTSRTYVQSVPKNYDAGKTYPLVFVFHGDGGNGDTLRGYFFFEAASGTDAIVIYPDGIDATWDLYDTDPNNHDFPFIASVIDKVAGSFTIDKKRVFAAGWSNGAFFANELACNRPGLIAAIASNSGGAPGTDQMNWPLYYQPSGYFKCVNNQQPVAAFVVQGAVDGTVTKDSGQFDATYWASVNGCASTSTATMPSPCLAYDSCPAGLGVVYCEIPNMGHAVWSGTASGAWAFFNAQKP